MSEQAAVKLAENLGREKKLRAWSWEEREGGVVVSKGNLCRRRAQISTLKSSKHQQSHFR